MELNEHSKEIVNQMKSLFQGVNDQNLNYLYLNFHLIKPEIRCIKPVIVMFFKFGIFA